MKCILLFFLISNVSFAQSVDDRYVSLVESLVRSKNANDDWYRKQNPDYYKSRENYQKYNDFKAQKYKEALEVRIEIQATFCKEDKKYCWSEKHLAFHQKEVDYNIKEDQLLMDQYLAKDKVAIDKALMDFHADKNKLLCEEFGEYCGVGEKKEVTEFDLPLALPTVIVPDVNVIIKKFPENDFVASTCVWSQDIPRRISFAPGCDDKTKSKLCIGYVICEHKGTDGLKFVRMSTCDASHCGEKDAVTCTKEKDFGSLKPKSEKNKNISEELKNIIIGTKES